MILSTMPGTWGCFGWRDHSPRFWHDFDNNPRKQGLSRSEAAASLRIRRYFGGKPSVLGLPRSNPSARALGRWTPSLIESVRYAPLTCDVPPISSTEYQCTKMLHRHFINHFIDHALEAALRFGMVKNLRERYTRGGGRLANVRAATMKGEATVDRTNGGEALGAQACARCRRRRRYP